MSKQPVEKLTPDQRELVESNLGLVGVHLRRVRNLLQPRRDREYDDLFQEGCLGLIAAARRYTSEHRMPFAAFAVPRIHNAVSTALHSRFRTVRMPTYRKGQQLPGEQNLSEEMTASMPARQERDAGAVRDRYLAAAASAAKRIRLHKATSNGHIDPVHAVTHQYLFTEDGYRPALRQIAHDSGRAHATVRGLLSRVCTLMHEELKVRTHPRKGPAIKIGDDITVVRSGSVKVGILAPDHIQISRTALCMRDLSKQLRQASIEAARVAV